MPLADHVVDLGRARRARRASRGRGRAGDRGRPRLPDRPVYRGQAGDRDPEEQRRPPAASWSYAASSATSRRSEHRDMHLRVFYYVTERGMGRDAGDSAVGGGRRCMAELRPKPTIKGLDQVDDVVDIDQSPIGRTPRSTRQALHPVRPRPASPALLRDPPQGPGSRLQTRRFQLNVKGRRCEVCGQRRADPVDAASSSTSTCMPSSATASAARTRPSIYRFKGRSIATCSTCWMTTRSSSPGHPQDKPASCDTTTTSASTTSGSASRRPALQRRASPGRHPPSPAYLYILDSHHAGLHFADVRRTLDVLGQYVEAGDTVVVASSTTSTSSRPPRPDRRPRPAVGDTGLDPFAL